MEHAVVARDRAEHHGGAVGDVGGSIVPRLSFGSLEITNCCTADTLYNSLIQGGGIDYRMGELTASTALSTQRVFDSCSNAQVGRAKIALASGSYYMKNCTDCRTDELVMTAAGAGNGGIAINGTRCIVGGGIQTGDRLFSYATRCVAVGVDATMVTGYDVSGTSNKFIGSRIGGAFYHLYGIGGTLQLSDAGSLNAPGFVRAAADIRSSSASGGIGYTTGAGGSVTQPTSKSTGSR